MPCALGETYLPMPIDTKAADKIKRTPFWGVLLYLVGFARSAQHSLAHYVLGRPRRGGLDTPSHITCSVGFEWFRRRLNHFLVPLLSAELGRLRSLRSGSTGWSRHSFGHFVLSRCMLIHPTPQLKIKMATPKG